MWRTFQQVVVVPALGVLPGTGAGARRGEDSGEGHGTGAVHGIRHAPLKNTGRGGTDTRSGGYRGKGDR